MEEEEELYRGKSFVDAAKAIKSGITYFTKDSVEKRKLQDQYKNVVPSFSLKARGGTEGAGSATANQNAGQTMEQAYQGVKNITDNQRASIESARNALTASNNAAQNILNVAGTISTSTDGARYSLMDPVSIKTKPTIAKPIQDLSITPTGEDMKKVGKEASEARMKAAERSTSKNRFGLFGNYGKDVEIKKVRDASTGLISKQKFVDGKRVQSGKERRASRKAFRRFK